LKRMGNVFDNIKLATSIIIDTAFERAEGSKAQGEMKIWRKKFVSEILEVSGAVDMELFTRITEMQRDWRSEDAKLEAENNNRDYRKGNL